MTYRWSRTIHYDTKSFVVQRSWNQGEPFYCTFILLADNLLFGKSRVEVRETFIVGAVRFDKNLIARRHDSGSRDRSACNETEQKHWVSFVLGRNYGQYLGTVSDVAKFTRP